MDENTKKALAARLDRVVHLARVYAPSLAGYVLLGSVVAELAPELYGAAVELLQRREPTPEEKTQLLAQLAALQRPEQL